MNVRMTFLFMLILSLPLAGQGQGIWRLRYSGDVVSLGINPLNPNTVFAVTVNGTLMVSYDKGGTWSTRGYVYPGGSILVHPVDTLVIFETSPSVLRSSDYGLTWTEVLPGDYIFPLVIDPNHPDTLYAGSIVGGEVYRTTDRGITWDFISNAGPDLCSLAVRPDSTNILYAGVRDEGGGGTIMKSIDGGFSWRITTMTGSDDIPFILIDFSDPKVAYATVHKGVRGVWKTIDGGENWDPTSPESFGDWYADIDRSGPAIVYVAAREGQAVYRSTNEGASWDTLDQGLSGLVYFWAIKAHPLSGDVWVAGDGIYQWVPLVSTVEGTADLAASYRLEQNYPNPFNPRTDVRYEISDVGFVRLVVYDILGREVATLVNERKAPGRYSVTWDATGQASGVYFYRLKAGSFTDTKRLMVLK